MLSFVLIIQISCNKLLDKYYHHHDPDSVSCSIKHITTQLSTEEQAIGTVAYNDAGNPVSFTYNIERAYELTPRYFFYDSDNKLTRYTVAYDSELNIQDHRYGYSGNTIIADTATYRLTGYTVVLSTFEYDSKGRIAVENQELIDGEGDPDSWGRVVYEYDANGNRVFGDGYTFDNKVNFRRTNDVWMFITRDYSQNNLIGATAYNEQGLPVQFDNSKDPLFFTGPLVSIDYDCNDAK